MGVEQHPDYEKEIEWLDFTKQYMKIVIKASESNEENFRENLKGALEGVDFKDSSFNYINMLTNSNLLRRTNEEVRNLKRNEKKPYFARINFKRDETGLEEILYFGKVSLFDKETQQPIIVDWRSQIANLYYDGRLGEVSYKAEGEEYEGYLSLKRQYIIDDGELEEIRDVDLTTTDELLQKSLSESASNRLTDIVSTIQEEQNNIIRADLNKPIIVQGAAGSGKTTIALHRISYFIYTYAEYFSPDQLMILAPNRLFIDYISEVLPELGVDNILQTTLVDFVKKCISKPIKLLSPEMKLLGFINGDFKDPDMVRWVAKFKGSFEFRDILDHYSEDILQTLLPEDDFFVSKFRLYKARDLRHLITHEYRYLPYYKRIEKVKKILQNTVRLEKKKMLHKVTSFYDDKLDKVLFKTKIDPEKRRSYVIKAMDKKEALIEEITKQSRTAVNAYIKKLPNHDLFYYYKKLVTDQELFAMYASDLLTEEQIQFFCHYETKLHLEKSYEQEDLAALLYLQSKLFGIKKELKARNVVIDEAQDYSYFQLIALKSALETDMFTIVGDLAQGIHSYRGINDWTPVLEEIFPRATYKTLQKSYRTTIEIMNAANELLKLLQLELPLVEPVVRHGEQPVFHKINGSEKNTITDLTKEIEDLYADGMKTIAIIGKTNKECSKLAKAFKKYSELPIQLLKENEEINKEEVVIVSSHLSKGLEFDAVIIYSNEEKFTENEIEIKLLYVSMTRPLHRLLFFGTDLSNFILHKVNRDLYIENPPH
ncbi:RNA polymerase recycling motor HelD [Fredinandcohnia quinoae]|uniref:DNA 3'-5' helicase n=1 Tax=Fredinandcohnia quinoae TaxID=2918902 RepID=A0AAW5E2P7_9BACI|nr:RNA polymerase recycling motor HelD [Fredinandcohnia sp. SECRCQ15]MCH1624261.1 UvrD-helicase domain-containing protein [Fredinandcohnia sp. SECRCQ15]